MSCSSELLSIEPGRGPGSAEAGRGCSADRSAPPRPARSACSALRSPSSDSVTEMPAQRAHSQSTRISCTRTRGPNSTHCLGRSVPHRTAQPRTTACIQLSTTCCRSFSQEAIAGNLQHPISLLGSLSVLLPSLGFLSTKNTSSTHPRMPRFTCSPPHFLPSWSCFQQTHLSLFALFQQGSPRSLLMAKAGSSNQTPLKWI